MFQRITIMGNLGQDPEMRYMPDGKAVANFSVAVNSSRIDRETEERVKTTTWFRCSVFGKRAEVITEYFAKGKAILVEGRLKSDPNTGSSALFTRQDGSVGTAFEINVDNWSFVPSSEGDARERSGNGGISPGSATAQEEDEIPF